MTPMSTLRNLTMSFALAAAGTFAILSPAFAQTTVNDASEAPAAAAPVAAEVPAAAPPTPAMAPDIEPPAPPKQTGPVYNPPPPSGKDWGKLPQETREQILNEWKSLPEKDREPFIFYRERAMAKLPDSAYSDNPYKPESPEAVAAKAAATAAEATAPAPAVEEKSSGGFFDKLMGKDGSE